MNRVCRTIFVLGIALGLSGCAEEQATPTRETLVGDFQSENFEKVRGPAVAGMFYPRHEKELSEKVDKLLEEAKPEPVENLRGLVCPHAGYEYSGITAAIGYKLLSGLDIRTVIVLAPTHTAAFEGASIADADAYETPLGPVPVSPKAKELAKEEPFVVAPECEVRRPGWWRQAPKELPAFGEDTPHSWEHSLEVQLPFLQRTLDEFDIVPIVFGQNVDPQAAARGLAKIIDERTLVVASSDLSHFLPYERARRLDTTCVKAICSLNVDWMRRQEACGRLPILVLMELARLKGWNTKELDYRNSGDTAGEKSRVVGYTAVAFYRPAKTGAAEEKSPPPAGPEFSTQQRKYLLRLARKTVEAAVGRQRLPNSDGDKMAEQFSEPRGCFVTLKKEGRLRGCIGSIFPQQSLYDAIVHAAASAAVRDRRFRPVQSSELKDIDVEVSVLTMPSRIEFASPDELLDKLRPGKDGVVLRVGSRESTYLPQVWEQMPDKQEFLGHLAEKAGLDRSAWKQAAILTYQVEAFHESEM